jgi:DNA-binding CsgD family transcriptional regulator
MSLDIPQSGKPGSNWSDSHHATVPELLPPQEWIALLHRFELSVREGEYLWHAFGDPRDDAIAERMGITTHGAHAHRMHLFRKLGVNGMAGALATVFREYLLQHRDGDWTEDNPHEATMRWREAASPSGREYTEPEFRVGGRQGPTG